MLFLWNINTNIYLEKINKDLKHTCQINQIPYNIKSHSFRINMISKLLQKTSAQNAADIIGHRDIKSTMAYKRYALNKCFMIVREKKMEFFI